MPDGGAVAARGARILLVDHDISVLEAVEAILRDRNHQVRTAISLPEAQQLLGEHEFDAVVADSEVRATNGAENLQEWITAKNPELARRLVWMSASAMPSSSQNHAGNGFLVLQKPFKAADLLTAVDLVLGRVQPAPIEG
jgi:DNA-binding NtrC family response regulator